MKLKLLTLFLVTLVLQAKAQNDMVIGPSNRSTTSLEKNMLFNATNFYTVTQSGGASFALANLFDGNFSPQYSGAIDETDPYVVVIEGLPDLHVQEGAWLGWTTRYYQPLKFKIEVYNSYNYGSPGYPMPNAWSTVADESNYGAFSYIVKVNMVSVTKIRFTFYKGAGPANAIGLSELFFIHPEGASAYDHLMVQYSTNGNVGIGTTTPQEKLSVNGKIRAKEIKVEMENWPDYVFKSDYENRSLPQIEAFIKANGHLPEVPPASQVEQEGIALGELNKILLKKIEELTLHLIEKNKELQQLKIENSNRQEAVQTLLMKQEKEIELLKKHLNIK